MLFRSDDNGEYKAADMSSALDQVNTIFGTITTVVGAIAGISLLVEMCIRDSY